VILESEMLIEEIAADAAKEIIRSRRDPIIQVKDIIEHKHDGSTNDGVDDSHHHEFHEGLVCE
jgi:hypothetical protein